MIPINKEDIIPLSKKKYVKMFRVINNIIYYYPFELSQFSNKKDKLYKYCSESKDIVDLEKLINYDKFVFIFDKFDFCLVRNKNGFVVFHEETNKIIKLNGI